MDLQKQTKLQLHADTPFPFFATEAKNNDSLQRFMTIFAKAFAAGYSLRVLLRLIPQLIRILKQRKKARTTITHIFLSTLTDSQHLRVGLFSGFFVAIYKSLMESTRRKLYRNFLDRIKVNDILTKQQQEKQKHDDAGKEKDLDTLTHDALIVKMYENAPSWMRYRGLLFGFLAGSSIAIAPKPFRKSFALFFAVRASELLVKHLVRKGFLPSFQHADILLMMAANAQVLWAWIFAPDMLDGGYLRFLNHHGGKADPLLRGVQGLHSDPSLINPVAIQKILTPLGRTSFDASHRYACCHITHPRDDSCTIGQLRYFLQCLRRAVPVYVPIYAAPLLIFHLRSLASSPITTLARASLGILRSSLFLASYCASAWASVCFCRNILGIRSQVVGPIAGVVGSCALLIEKKPRRIEIAMYVAMNAVDSIHRCAKKWQWLGSHQFADVAVFAIAAAVILQTNLGHPQIMQDAYRSILNRVMGQVGTDADLTQKQAPKDSK
eukprot:TRINITY_DN2596_c0_g1_i3.p1 TRINITY_DN2596_c0_g1~~TRINITY_DN2596_c0_g1_i3.p1  ORF type:complete len:495 (+),score=96.21 TRINITY_DN2596_c0_g1_i3:59-1543(+)